MSPGLKAGLMVLVGLLFVAALACGLLLDHRLNRGEPKVWLNWLAGACGALCLVAGVFLVLFTYYAYRWFTSPIVLQVVIGVPVILTISVFWDETKGKPGWRAFLIVMALGVLCSFRSPPA